MKFQSKRSGPYQVQLIALSNGGIQQEFISMTDPLWREAVIADYKQYKAEKAREAREERMTAQTSDTGHHRKPNPRRKSKLDRH